VAESEKELAAGEAVMRMPPAGQPQMPFPGMPMMHMQPGMPGMPPNFRGMMMPFVSVTVSVFVHFCCRLTVVTAQQNCVLLSYVAFVTCIYRRNSCIFARLMQNHKQL